MLLKKGRLIIYFMCSVSFMFINAQEKDSLFIKNGIENPDLLPTHHFGIFSSRINTNFKYKPDKKSSITFTHSSGNTFHPYVEAYFPKNPEIREQLSQITWHDRPFTFVDQEKTPAEYMSLVIDAVIKTFRVTVALPINKQHELSVSLRSYLITQGKQSFSPVTGDHTIEWFHSNLAGGEDPFGRRYYGLNQVNYNYLDRNGNTLTLNNNDFFVGGLELSHYFYPNLALNTSKKIYLNIGSHLGVNTSKFNPSVDLGLSLNAIKKFKLSSNYELNLALGGNLLQKNTINFNEVIDLGNNPYLGTCEGELEFTKYTRKGNYNAIGINYQIQSRYNQKAEADYYKLQGKWREINGGWQNGVFTLYEPLSSWSLIYSYKTPKYILTLFAKQDFRVHNAPDFETGIGLKIPVFQ